MQGWRHGTPHSAVGQDIWIRTNQVGGVDEREGQSASSPSEVRGICVIRGKWLRNTKQVMATAPAKDREPISGIHSQELEQLRCHRTKFVVVV